MLATFLSLKCAGKLLWTEFLSGQGQGQGQSQGQGQGSMQFGQFLIR